MRRPDVIPAKAGMTTYVFYKRDTLFSISAKNLFDWKECKNYFLRQAHAMVIP